MHRFLDNPGGFQIGGRESTSSSKTANRRSSTRPAGMRIVAWHIDEAKSGNQGAGHTAGPHRLVDLEEADGPGDLDQNGNNSADAGDPFPGSTNNRLFGASTNPSSDLYSGSDSNVRMWVQSTSCASSMSAAFGPNAHRRWRMQEVPT